LQFKDRSSNIKVKQKEIKKSFTSNFTKKRPIPNQVVDWYKKDALTKDIDPSVLNPIQKKAENYIQNQKV